MNRFRLVGLTLLTLLVPTFAFAHSGHGSPHGFFAGLVHPFTGIDHLCAMLATGFWAAQMGRHYVRIIPLAFLGAMGIGALFALMGFQAPMVEQGIAISVLTVGVLIAASARLSVVSSVVLVSAFAIFHGYAHGAEMPAAISGTAYAAGFVTTTLLLMLAGIGIGQFLQQFSMSRTIRFVGVTIATVGGGLLLTM
jgi:urease accessory protein